MKKIVGLLTAAVMLLGIFPVVIAETENIVTVNGVPYVMAGENLFEMPNFTNGTSCEISPQWYVGVNTTTEWDGSIPNPNTGENLTLLKDVCTFREGVDSGSVPANSFYFGKDKGGTLGGEARDGSYLCENITDAKLSFWNGKGALLCYVPIEAGKTYYFSYNVSSWGNTANSSVRYGAVNSAQYCGENGDISWSGEGYLSVGSYNGNNMTQKGAWAKKEGIITAGEDADYFFFNLYWLQDTNYVCLNGFKLVEAEAAEIAEVDKVYVSTYAGEEPKLPDTVGVTYQNGIKGSAKVIWEKTYDIHKDGVYPVTGTVEQGGRTYTADAEVTVYSDSLSADYTIARKISFDNGLINASFGIYSENEKPVTAAIALYDGKGTLAQVRCKSVKGDDVLTMSAPIYDGYYVKSYVWDENLMPLALSDSHTAEIQEGGQFMSISDVTLLGGMFKDAQDVNVNYLLNVEPDRLLAPVFESAGLPAKASRYGGWEAQGHAGWGRNMGISGHSLGHWMSAVSTSFEATGNTELKERLDYTVSELARVQKETGSGYIGGLSEEPFKQAFDGTINSGGFNLNGAWVPWYSVHKIYQGLIDAYVNTKNQEALETVIKFADWAVDGTEELSDSQMQKMLDTEYGGMNDVFAQLYDITKDERYLKAAVRFTHDTILNPLANGKDELTGKHANTQIPKIIGAAAIYEQDESRTDYKNASEFFWNTVVNNRSFVIGGNSVSEHFEALGAESLHKKTCESCNTYNMIKLSEHLYSWEHDSKYMDYVENALYNDILGAQDPETGNKMYFTSLLQGHFRVYGTPEDSWWCCTGSGMENPGRYAKCIYYKDTDSIFVNLYIPSKTVWNETGLELTMETDFPYSDKVKITVEGENSAKINLRVPSWISGEMSVSVNGEIAATQSESGYIELERAWKNGDIIEITLPMALSVYTARDNENKVAFKYGPVVLGADMGVSSRDVDTQKSEYTISDTTVPVPSLKTESSNPEDFISVVDLSKLIFEIDGKYTSNNSKITLSPFYGIHHEFHNVYWYLNSQADPYQKALNDITVDSVTPDGQQDEIGHLLESKNSHNGSFTSGITTYYWRDAYGSDDAYFSYEMKVDSENKNYLYVSYWGSDGGFNNNGVGYTRDFDILADDVKIGSQSINNDSPNNTVNVFYDIPEELTKGKDSIRIKFAVKNAATCAGGVLDARITKADKVEY